MRRFEAARGRRETPGPLCLVSRLPIPPEGPMAASFPPGDVSRADTPRPARRAPDGRPPGGVRGRVWRLPLKAG
jgi:hypothetical protein